MPEVLIFVVQCLVARHSTSGPLQITPPLHSYIEYTRNKQDAPVGAHRRRFKDSLGMSIAWQYIFD